MNDYTYRKIITNRDDISTGVQEVNVPDEVVKQIRADAIDDFAKRLKAECREHYIDCEPCFGGIVENILYEDDIEEIAELLKEQEK